MYKEFAQKHGIKRETLRNWIYDSRQKMEARAGIVEILQETQIRTLCGSDSIDTFGGFMTYQKRQ